MTQSIIATHTGLKQGLVLLALNDPLSDTERELLVNHIREAQRHLCEYEKFRSKVIAFKESPL